MRTSTSATCGLALLDLLERLLAVARPGDHLDPALGQVLRDRLEHRRVVVGDDAGDGWLRGGAHRSIPDPGIPVLGDGYVTF